MNLKKELKKLDIYDLKFICNEVGIKYNKKSSKQIIIRELLKPINKKYKYYDEKDVQEIRKGIMDIINNYDPDAPDKEYLKDVFKTLDNKLKKYYTILQKNLSFYEGVHPITGEKIIDYGYQESQKQIKKFKNKYMERRWSEYTKSR